MSTNQHHLEFDADSLRNKHREEGDKRLRKHGNEQDQEVSGKFAHCINDPYTQEEMDLVVPLLNKTDNLFLAIRWYCGLRPGEVAALTWSDYRDGYFSVTKSITDGEEGKTKTDHERTAPVHPKVQQMLMDT